MVIKEIKGDIFKSNAEVLVNAVNTIGIMGAGISFAFKVRYPEMYVSYKEACDKKEIKIGTCHIYPFYDTYPNGEYKFRRIINFPTISTIGPGASTSNIERGLINLKDIIIDKDIESIALPALGCGYGGFDFDTCKSLVEYHLEDINCEIELYLPNWKEK